MKSGTQKLPRRLSQRTFGSIVASTAVGLAIIGFISIGVVMEVADRAFSRMTDARHEYMSESHFASSRLDLRSERE